MWIGCVVFVGSSERSSSRNVYATWGLRSSFVVRVALVLCIVLVHDLGMTSAAAVVADPQVETVYRTRASASKTPPNGRVALGFTVARHGFSFSNWAGLTPEDALTFANMARLLGSLGTCFEDPTEPSCTLRNGKRLDLSTINSYVSSGRCEGMTVLAARLFAKPAEIATLDSRAATAFELTKESSARELAYISMTQLLPEIQGFSARTKFKKPYVLAQEIIFQMKRKRLVSLGVYGDGFGHSILPFAVKYSARATVFSVYDPNFPNEVRTLKVDHLRGSWSYDKAVLADGSIGRMKWTGSGRLDYVPINLRYAKK